MTHLYYDYILAVLQVFEGRDSVRYEAQRKIERCRERAAAFGNRRFSYEWLGQGTGLEMLVHYTDLPPVWDRNRLKMYPVCCSESQEELPASALHRRGHCV